MNKLTAEDKIYRAKIQLQPSSDDKTGKPFFAYLLSYMRIEEDKMGICKQLGGGMGISMSGHMIWDRDFVNKCTVEEISGVLCHEVMHVVLNHLERCGGRDRMIFNISNDLVVNNLLIKYGLNLPKDGMIPNNDSFSFGWVNINNIDKKLSEEIYDELYNQAKKQKNKKGQSQGGDGSGKSDSSGSQLGELDKKRFDNHTYGEEGKKGKGGKEGEIENISHGDMEKLKKKWKKILAEAAVYSKQRGLLPAGMERMIDELLDSKVSWRHKLYKYISNEIMSDYRWCMPHKKSFSTGVYMPSIVKEKIEMVVHVDTSGSISQKELKEFVAEIVSIGASFPNIDMDLLFCDAAIYDVYKLDRTSVHDILNYKIHGGGGTSHSPVIKWIAENKPDCKLFISLTDGYSDIETTYPLLPNSCNNIIVMSAGNHMESKKLEEHGEIIIIE